MASAFDVFEVCYSLRSVLLNIVRLYSVSRLTPRVHGGGYALLNLQLSPDQP